jgi:hypothetical protein
MTVSESSPCENPTLRGRTALREANQKSESNRFVYEPGELPPDDPNDKSGLTETGEDNRAAQRSVTSARRGSATEERNISLRRLSIRSRAQ